MSEVILPPAFGLAMPPWVTPLSRVALGMTTVSLKSLGGGVSTAWGTNNDIIYYPFEANQSFWIRRFGWLNGTVVAGNIDIGLYDASYVKLLAAGSTAQATVSVIQLVDVTDTLFQPGRYFVGVWASDSTATFMSFGPLTAALFGRWAGMSQENSAGLPSTATPVTLTKTFLPYAGFSQRDTA